MAQLQSTSITGSLIVTGGITGSFSGSIVAPGSTTQVLYNNSGVISANSGFVYSGSNVGIGTTNPSYKLSVVAASTSDGIQISYGGASRFVFNGDGVAYWGGSSADAGQLTWDTGKAIVMGMSGQALSLGSNGTWDKMYIDTSGNVGIGTTTPSALLSGTERVVEISNSNVASLYLDSTSGRKWSVSSISDGSITFWDLDAVAERMRINSSGNVGIGTTSPSYKLTLRDNDPSFGIMTLISNYANGGTAVSGSRILWDATNVGNFWEGMPPGANAWGIGLYNGSTNPEYIRVTSAGNVGIGTSNPSTKLEVNGTGKFGAYAYIGTSIDQGYYVDSANGAYRSAAGSGDKGYYFQNYGGAATAMYVGLDGSYAGRIGIGTTTPGYDIHIAKSGTESGILTSYGASEIYLSHGGWGIGASKFGIGDGSAPTITIDTSNDRLGINTTSPGYKLDVNGDANFAANQYHTIGGNKAFGGNGSSYLYFYTGTTALSVRNNADNAELFRIADGGNVGIGTSSPQGKLSVDGGNIYHNYGNASSAYYLYLNHNSTQDGGMLWTRDNSTFDWQINNATSGNLWFYSYGLGAVALTMVKSSGNIGIGTTSPSYKLHVYQYSGDVAYFDTPGGGYVKFTNGDIDSNSSQFGFRGASGTKAYIGANGGQHLTIDTSGNVGIGTTSPGAKLEVNGSFRATTKSFIIDHPTKENKKLQYGVLEGPEHSVYVRGKLTNTNVIQLPDYWHALVHEDSITVNLTAIGKKQDLWVEEITDTYITVASETGDINCFYAVFAERKDVEKLVTEFDKE